jgi:hypothetical protein
MNGNSVSTPTTLAGDAPEVGANLIARTAHAALKLLDDLIQVTELAIPLAWEQGRVRETCAIEVYPSRFLAISHCNLTVNTWQD